MEIRQARAACPDRKSQPNHEYGTGGLGFGLFEGSRVGVICFRKRVTCCTTRRAYPRSSGRRWHGAFRLARPYRDLLASLMSTEPLSSAYARPHREIASAHLAEIRTKSSSILHGSKKSLPTPSADVAVINLRPVLCSICSTLFRDVSRKSRLSVRREDRQGVESASLLQ